MKKFLLLFLLFACSVHAQTAIPGLRNPTDSAGQVPTSGLNGQVYWMSIDGGNIGGTTLASGITASSLTSFGSGIALGTPASGTLTNCTFPTLNQNTTGNAGTVTNGLYSTGSYSNPSWLTSISGGIVSGNISGNAANVTGTVAIANGGTGAATTSQNYFFAGPTSGSGAPAFRAIVSGDIPTLNQNTSGSAGSVLFSGIGAATNTNALLIGTGGSLGTSGSGIITATAVPASGITGTTLASNVITSSLTTVGTIGTGTWNGTTIAIANGGTGQTSANNALNALLPSQTGASGKVLQSDGTNTSWQTAGGGSVSITSSTSNITVSPSPLTGTGTVDINLAYANNWTASDTVSMAGATNSTNDGEAYITLQNTTHGYNVVGHSLTQSSPAIQFLGHVANSIGGNDTTIYFYEWNSPQGSHFPSANLTWATGTDAAKDLTIVATLNQLGEYQVLQGFQIGGLSSSGHYLRGNGTDYVDGTIQVGDVPTLNQNTSGTAAGLSATLAVSSGGTGLGTLTAHDVLVGAGTSNVTLISPTSNTGYVLTSNGTGSDPTFQAAGGGAFPVPVQVDSGGTGDITLTSKGVLYGNGTSAVGVTAAGNAGGFLAGSGANLTNPIFTDSLFNNNLATTYTMGFGLFDTTHATAGTTVMQSPSIILGGNAWCTTATAADSIRNWRITNVPSSQSSGSLSVGTLRYDFGNSNIGYTNAMSISGSGAMNVPSGGSYSINNTIVLNSATLGSGVTTSSLTSLGTLTGLTMNKANITTTYTPAPIFENTTASTNGVPVQQSPSLELLAHDWSTTATATDSLSYFLMTNVPTSSANPLVSNLIFSWGHAAAQKSGDITSLIKLKSTGDLSLTTGHLTSASTIGSATDDGTGITSASVAGSDVAGTVTLTSAINAGGGTATITFGTAYVTAPTVVVTPNNALGVTAGSYYVTSTTAHFVINFPTTVVAASATFNYIVVGPTP